MKRFIVAALMVVTMSGAFLNVTTTPVAAAGCTNGFLTFPAWYKGLINTSSCELNSPNAVGGIGPYITKIALNVIEILLQLVAYVSIAFIMFGGFMYLTSGGESARITSGRKTIMNAIIGLVLSFFSVVIVSLIGSNIK